MMLPSKYNWNQEQVKTLQEFQGMDEAEQKRVLFESLMGLLDDAVKEDDAVMMKSYARLVTEMFFDEGEE
jgi:hypothetical protein